MKKTRIFFRVDANAQIGLGHLVRCIALAQMLKDDFEIYFACKTVPESTVAEIEQLGFKLNLIETEEEFLISLSYNVIVVLDHYGLDTDYQKSIKDKGCKLVCIDDLHDKVFFADVIINTTPNIRPEDYTAQLYTQFAMGLDYVLLRPPFLIKSQWEYANHDKGVLLICFGGADSSNITQRTLGVVYDDKRFEKIIVVTGAAYTYEESLSEIVAQNLNIEWHRAISAEKMAELMSRSEYAIVPASGILQEALACGCKIISGMYVENQKYVFDNYLILDAFVSSGDFSVERLKNAIDTVIDHGFVRLKLIDGKAPERLKTIFNQLLTESLVTLRKATKEDLPVTYKWAGNETIRKFSFNKTAIEYSEHRQWFLDKLNDRNCFFYIGLLNGEPFGCIRFDVEEAAAKISFLIDPEFQNRSLGTILLKKGAVELSKQSPVKLLTIWGDVFAENMASQRIFAKLGYAIYNGPIKNVWRFKKEIEKTVSY